MKEKIKIDLKKKLVDLFIISSGLNEEEKNLKIVSFINDIRNELQKSSLTGNEINEIINELRDYIDELHKKMVYQAREYRLKMELKDKFGGKNGNRRI